MKIVLYFIGLEVFDRFELIKIVAPAGIVGMCVHFSLSIITFPDTNTVIYIYMYKITLPSLQIFKVCFFIQLKLKKQLVLAILIFHLI